MIESLQTVIVGGGVIGLSLAWELAQRGRSVSVFDAGQMGRGASWAGAGILPAAAKRNATDPYEQLRAYSHALHPQWAERLRATTGIDTGFQRCGGVYLACSPAEAATLAANRGWWEAHAIEHEAWSIDELKRREPAVATQWLTAGRESGVRSVWYLPDDCQLRNPRYLQALTAACQQHAVKLRESVAVTHVEAQTSGSIRISTADQLFEAEQVCICSGAWARQLLSQLGLPSGIMPVRGQMVLYNCGEPLLASVINEGHRYLVARRDGRLLAGSIEEEVGYAVETTAEGISQIRGWAETILPALKHQPIERTWAGLRPGSFDGFPYLGGVPGCENLFLAAGHFRSGLHLSCATAVLMANEMQGLPQEIDLIPFRVGRG